MSRHHLVRIGALGHVGRFTAVDAIVYSRASRVICRTSRGLEVGEVLSHATNGREGPSDGSLLRLVTVEDDLLLARLEKNRDKAYAACCELLAERNLPVVLMDVEHLFDGTSLYFYFLGESVPELETIPQQLAEIYEANVQFRQFTEAATLGCGPNCGTEDAEGGGCGSGSCATCAVSDACKLKDRN